MRMSITIIIVIIFIIIKCQSLLFYIILFIIDINHLQSPAILLLRHTAPQRDNQTTSRPCIDLIIKPCSDPAVSFCAMLNPSERPVIPQRTSARTALNPKSKAARRRRSLPAASHPVVKRRTSNHVVVKPASTEVISSLIETLSAISSPAEHHFDSLPSIASSQSTPASPRSWKTDSPLATAPTSRTPQGDSMRPTLLGLGKDLDVRRRAYGLHDHHFLHPDRSLPGRKSSDKSLREDVNESTDPYDMRRGYSIGNLSIERKPSITTSHSYRSDGGESPNSSTIFRLGLNASQDSLRESDGLVISKSEREEKPLREGYTGHSNPGSPRRDQLVLSKRGTRGNIGPEPPNIPTRASSVQSNGSRRTPYCSPEGSCGESNGKKKFSMPNEDHIPTRNSSMRHSQRLSPSRLQRRSQLSESSSGIEPYKAPSENQPNYPEQAPLEVPVVLAEDSVGRRIKELKEQKLERERSSMETPTEFFSAPQTPDRSPAPSPGPTASLTTSTCALPLKHKIDEVEVLQSELLDDIEKGAPSPAIAQRIDRDNGEHASFVESRSAIVTDSAAISRDGWKSSSLALPKRSNSRLLKRFSRSLSPAPVEERRTVSNSILETKSYQIDEADPIHDAVDHYILSSRLSQKISDPQTGRIISFSEVGDPEGSVVFCCVGMGLTRFITAFYDELASTLKLRLVTPDRPGVGGSESHMNGLGTPLGWPDDVRAICQHLKINKFSLLAHSAGAIYALATALRMPQHIRCRVHLLAPWIPPSQMFAVGTQQDLSPARSLPYSQRFLRSLPMTFLRAANSSFLNATSASVTTSLYKSPRRSKRTSLVWAGAAVSDFQENVNGGDSCNLRNGEITDPSMENEPPNARVSTPANGRYATHIHKERRSAYDTRLTEAIWDAATTGTNPAVDLLVCLERRQPIGFRYVDITRSVVIHHGSKDSRVPVENVQWLGKTMRRCEVRVVEGEGHGLMASASVMGNVLMEMAQEWSDWNRVVKGKGGMDRRVTNAV